MTPPAAMVAFIQARMASTRLPGKVLLPLAGEPMLVRVVERVRRCRGLGDVVVVTGKHPTNAPIRSLCKDRRIECFSGENDDVLARFARAAACYEPDYVLRVTADCPCTDPATLSSLLDLHLGRQAADYAGVATVAVLDQLEQRRLSSVDVGIPFPDGVDAEVFSVDALQVAAREATSPVHREHVTPFIWTQPDRFRVRLLWSLAPSWTRHRLTVDTPEDYQVIFRLFKELGPDADLGQMSAWMDAHGPAPAAGPVSGATRYGDVR